MRKSPFLDGQIAEVVNPYSFTDILEHIGLANGEFAMVQLAKLSVSGRDPTDIAKDLDKNAARFFTVWLLEKGVVLPDELKLEIFGALD